MAHKQLRATQVAWISKRIPAIHFRKWRVFSKLIMKTPTKLLGHNRRLYYRSKGVKSAAAAVENKVYRVLTAKDGAVNNPKRSAQMLQNEKKFSAFGGVPSGPA